MLLPPDRGPPRFSVVQRHRTRRAAGARPCWIQRPLGNADSYLDHTGCKRWQTVGHAACGLVWSRTRGCGCSLPHLAVAADIPKSEQAALRRTEFDQFAMMMAPASKNWYRRVATYLRASRERCRQLGLYFDPRRGPPASAPLPMSPDVEAELIGSTILLVGWRKELLEVAADTDR